MSQHEILHKQFVEKGLPDYMWGAFERYYWHGIMPGDFLYNILCCNLLEACMHADSKNRRVIFEWVDFLWNGPVGGCWKSRENVEAWMERKGLHGVPKFADADNPPPEAA